MKPKVTFSIMEQTEQKNKELKPYWVLIFSLVFIGLSCAYLLWSAKQTQLALLERLQLSENERAGTNEKVAQFRDKNDRLNTVVKYAELDRKYMEVKFIGLLDSVAKMGVKNKNLQAALRIRNSTGGVITTIASNKPAVAPYVPLPPLVASDSANVYQNVNYADRWLSLTGRVPLISGQAATFGYRYRDDYIITHEFYRPKWYKPKELSLRVVPQNPATDSTSVQQINIKEPKRFYQTTGFKLGAGAVLLKLVQIGVKSL